MNRIPDMSNIHIWSDNYVTNTGTKLLCLQSIVKKGSNNPRYMWYGGGDDRMFTWKGSDLRGGGTRGDKFLLIKLSHNDHLMVLLIRSNIWFQLLPWISLKAYHCWSNTMVCNVCYRGCLMMNLCKYNWPIRKYGYSTRELIIYKLSYIELVCIVDSVQVE